MDSSKPRLNELQREVLTKFFERERGFYLTGGGALVGYVLGHRHTDDLDLFTNSADAFERGTFALRDVAVSLGASLETRQEAPGFRRLVLSRGTDAVVVDLVHEQVPQLYTEKSLRDGIAVDPPQEILANKLNTLVSRAEERDLVDVMFLEKIGFSVEEALPGALAKDGGCTPANLAWVLSQIEIPDSAELPANVEPAELRAYLQDLVRRLRRVALPNE